MRVPDEAMQWATRLGRRTRRLVKMGAQLAAHVGQAPVRACRGAACEGVRCAMRG